MMKKNNILKRALAKLSLMQKQLVEESRVLDELKEQEEADECELETLRSALSSKAGDLHSLDEELKRMGLEKEKLETRLENSYSEFKTLLETQKALASDYEYRLAQLDADNAALKAELREQKTENETLRQLHFDTNCELERTRSEKTAVQALQEAGQLKITELQVFSASAASALKETKEECELLKERMKYILEELSR